ESSYVPGAERDAEADRRAEGEGGPRADDRQDGDDGRGRERGDGPGDERGARGLRGVDEAEPVANEAAALHVSGEGDGAADEQAQDPFHTVLLFPVLRAGAGARFRRAAARGLVLPRPGTQVARNESRSSAAGRRVLTQHSAVRATMSSEELLSALAYLPDDAVLTVSVRK